MKSHKFETVTDGLNTSAPTESNCSYSQEKRCFVHLAWSFPPAGLENQNQKRPPGSAKRRPADAKVERKDRERKQLSHWARRGYWTNYIILVQDCKAF